jgi:hypothetical protein
MNTSCRMIELRADSYCAASSWARRSRGNQIAAQRRVWERDHGQRLIKLSTRMSETYGFAHCTIIRYAVEEV